MTNDMFDWQTEEDEAIWEEQTAVSPSPSKPRHHFYWVTGLIIMLVGLSGFVAYRQLEQRAELTETAVSDDILSSHQLLQQAIVEQDFDLFNILLSGSNRRWTGVQQMLFQEGLLLERTALGFEWQLSVPQIISTTISPDLKGAELIVAQEYRGGLDGQSFTLHQTAVYRQGRQRWLYSPPSADFWGGWRTANGRYLQLTYPARDETLALRLLADLDADIEQVCRQLTLACAENDPLLLRFDTDPAGLAEVADATVMLKRPFLFNLPTPTLVGLPIDESGYNGLRRGYAAHVVASILLNQIDWKCCNRGLFLQALLDKQLAELGFKRWPLGQATYALILSRPIASVDSFSAYWQAPPTLFDEDAVELQIYALVDFILSRGAAPSLLQMMQKLAESERYSDWIDTYMPRINQFGVVLPHRDYLRFLQAQATVEQAQNWPQQDIQIMCKSGGNKSTVYRFDPQQSEWIAESENLRFLFMAPFADDSGVMLLERFIRLDRAQIVSWQAGTEAERIDEVLESGIFRVDQVAAGLLLYGFDFGSKQLSFRLLDVESCQKGECVHVELQGLPSWSPNGERTIIADQIGRLWLGGARGQIQSIFGNGTVPFWLDDETVGYVTLAVESAEIVLQSFQTGVQHALLPLDELEGHLPDGILLEQVSIRGIVVNPANPQQLFIGVAMVEDEGDGGFVFRYDMQTGAWQRPLSTAYDLNLYQPFTFSPDGRWLTVQTFSRGSSRWELHLLDVETNETKSYQSDYPFTFPGYDWSADSRWLLRVDNGFIQLIEPDTGYSELLVHDFSSCNFAAWVD